MESSGRRGSGVSEGGELIRRFWFNCKTFNSSLKYSGSRGIARLPFFNPTFFDFTSLNCVALASQMDRGYDHIIPRGHFTFQNVTIVHNLRKLTLSELSCRGGGITRRDPFMGQCQNKNESWVRCAHFFI
jgi:hypothetical protein